MHLVNKATEVSDRRTRYEQTSRCRAFPDLEPSFRHTTGLKQTRRASSQTLPSRQVQLLLCFGQFVLEAFLPPVQIPSPHSVRLPARQEAGSEGNHDGDLQRPLGEVCHVFLCLTDAHVRVSHAKI